ncbi:MAG: hypothetical protein KGN84_16035, partial [Acidobacteriota bacterium]|nr:hypothetical protein [Acidobacteriota bacterium]
MMTRRSLLQSALSAAAIPRDPATDSFAKRIYAHINDLREARGSPRLIWSPLLAECATGQSTRKVELRFPGHDDPERGDIARRLSAAGILWQRCGENLFMERGWDDPANFAVVFWWYSPGHQENLLNPLYTHTGVGLCQGADKAWFVTQIFTL